jgi:hypothetical protein
MLELALESYEPAEDSSHEQARYRHSGDSGHFHPEHFGYGLNLMHERSSGWILPPPDQVRGNA